MNTVILDHYEKIVEDNMHFMEQAKLKRNLNFTVKGQYYLIIKEQGCGLHAALHLVLYEEGRLNMTKLFITGNGFDTAHGLPTKYSDFRNYMYENYAENQKYYYLPDPGYDNHGNVVVDYFETGKYLFNILDISCLNADDMLWQDFENDLGKLEYNTAFEYSDFNEVYDKEGDIDEYRTAYNRENIGQRINETFRYISVFFSDWVNTIEVKKARKKDKFVDIACGGDSLFLNFNYTLTLEKVYNIPEKDVLHIHGISGDNIIVGQGLRNERIS